MRVADIDVAHSHLDLSGTNGSDLSCHGFELAPELAHFAISEREIFGPSPQPTLDDNLPMGATSLHASS
jgi:hypothetical protein